MICQACGRRDHGQCYDLVHDTAYASCPCQCSGRKAAALAGRYPGAPEPAPAVPVPADTAAPLTEAVAS